MQVREDREGRAFVKKGPNEKRAGSDPGPSLFAAD